MKIIQIIISILFLQANSFADDLSFGIGFGIPYGGLVGVNADYKITKKIDLTAGAGLGYGAGFKYHPLHSIQEFRVTTFYGTNSSLTNSATNEKETFSGFNIGIGYGSLKNGWGFDLIYIVTSDADDEVDKLRAQSISIQDYNENSVKLSFGYHW